MNNHQPAAERDELCDRLIDGSLRELIGGEKAPELSERILAAGALRMAEPASVTQPDLAVNSVRGWSARSRRILYFAVAAAILLAATPLLLPKLQLTQERAAWSRQAAIDVAARSEAQRLDRERLLKRRQEELRIVESGTEEEKIAAKIAKNAKDRGAKPAAELAHGASPSFPSEPASVAPLADGSEPMYAADQLAAASPVAPVAGGYGRGGGGYGGRGGRAWYRGGYGRGGEYQSGVDYYSDAGVPITKGKTSSVDLNQPYRQNSFGLAGAAPQQQSEFAESETLRRGVTEAEVFSFSIGFERGSGPAAGGDKYNRIEDNPFKSISLANTENRLSTFSIDVDTASYANVRQFLMQERTLPPPDAVRIEELVNYFAYDYSPPTGDVPFASHVEIAGCPWNREHRLVRIGVKGRELENRRRPPSNLVFLIDVSGSMDEPNKLPLLIEGMKLLTRELGENDRVAIVVYASSEGLALESTRGDKQVAILGALDRLRAVGSTAGGAGIQLAYQVAKDHFVKGGVNRVILCTDGDFNVGVTSPAELERMAKTNAKETGVFLTVLGFGRGNLNDAMMEQIADRGNGNYHYVDGRSEARKVLVEEMTGTLVTIAKDVKIQVEFNPGQVAGYRLIGYENRVLAAEDFNDDTKDAGEIGAGHTVTALYEVVPVGGAVGAGDMDELKYGVPRQDAGEVASATSNQSSDLLTLKIRYKEPDGDTSRKLEFPIADGDQSFAAASEDFRFAAAVAGFGMLLRNSPHKGDASFASVLEIAQSATGDKDPHGYRREFVTMIERARELAGDSPRAINQ